MYLEGFDASHLIQIVELDPASLLKLENFMRLICKIDNIGNL